MRFALLALLCLASCGKPAHFAGTTPVFDPLTFWTGHRHSWGILEGRSGVPTESVATDCTGILAADGSLNMQQILTESDGTTTHRAWHMWRTGPASFAATANDMVGEAHGTAQGRVFHWQWVLALSPGNPLKNVTMDQWMYFYEDGSMMNRTVIRKFGIVAAEVSEVFR